MSLAKPLPRLSPDNEPFWEACRAGELRLPTCEECGKPHLPPGPVCPFCFGDKLAWRRATGRGRISSFTVVHKAWFPSFRDEIPYNVIQVELEEGPRLTANLVQATPEQLRIGQAVEILFDKINDSITLPRFRPMAG